jgi:outer membrane protein
MKRIILSALVVLFTVASIAQTKVGTVDADFILSKMPELSQANEELKNYNLDLEKQLKTKIDSYEATLKTAQEAFESMTDEQKQTKQEELSKMEGEIKQFQANGTQLVQLKQSEVVQPLYKKIGEEVAKYAKAQGFTQILTVGNNNNFAYYDPSFDITIAVLSQMGIALE